MRKDAEDDIRDIAVAAYWKVARPDLPLKAIADQLDVNRNTIDRRIEEAINKGWIANSWVFKDLPEDLWKYLASTSDPTLEKKIIGHCGIDNLPKLTVVPAWPSKSVDTFNNPKDYEDYQKEVDDTNMKMVAHTAAKVFIERLPNMKVIGLSYGRTLQKMIDILEHFAAAVRNKLKNKEKKEKDYESNAEKNNRTIVTIVGSLFFHFSDPRHEHWLESSASLLTNRLARIIGTDKCTRCFLETPVYIPPAFIKQYPETIKSNLKGTTQPLSRETAIKTVKAFIEAIPSYHDLFVEGESKIKNLDTLITSVGDLGTGFGSFTEQQQQPLLLDKKEREALLQDAVGDIAGRYVTKDGDTGKEGSAIAKVNERIFGLTLDNLEEIARRKPGVIVIASSRKKARVILALLKRPKKVISELIISGDLAEELANLLDKR